MPRLRIDRRRGAERDIVECALTIADERPDVAEEFLDAVEATLQLLAENPLVGRTRGFENPKLHELRSHAVKGFGNFLIFYVPTATGIDVVHVYHGARDLDALLGDEQRRSELG